VPCKLVDGVWVVLEEPNKYTSNLEINDEYQQAKERCLFEGFSRKWWDDEKTILDLFFNDDKFYFYYCTNGYFSSNHNNIESPKTIEDLVKYNLELTPTAQKQIGL